MQKEIRIPKETNFQKWLEECRIYLESDDVVVGEIYDGSYSINGQEVSSDCRTVYYNAPKKILLAESLEDKRYFALSGRMFVYKNKIYANEYSMANRPELSSDFIKESIEKLPYSKEELTKEIIVSTLRSNLSPKISGYFKGLFEIIAEAFLKGLI